MNKADEDVVSPFSVSLVKVKNQESAPTGPNLNTPLASLLKKYAKIYPVPHLFVRNGFLSNSCNVALHSVLARK